MITIHQADCLDLLRTLGDATVDAIVTDPPYGLADHKPKVVTAAITAWTAGDREHVPDGKGFMGRAWDAFVPPPAVWDECLRVLKPGGHLLCFAGTRTVDLMGLSIRLAGFEIRDSITWHYGSGFPKSLDVSKAIDKAAGAEREVIGEHHRHGGGSASSDSMSGDLGTASVLPLTAPATDAARQWAGWGTALKPASEPIIVARKPLGGTVAANVIEHGTGGLNVDACRVGHSSAADLATSLSKNPGRNGETVTSEVNAAGRPQQSVNAAGRWPSNVVLSHVYDCGSDEPCELHGIRRCTICLPEFGCAPGCPVAELDAQSGILKSGDLKPYVSASGKSGGTMGETVERDHDYTRPGDSGGASRYFPTFRYQAKAPTKERPKVDGVSHPTVKPLALMRWLVRLVTPPGGTILDPFAGSGTTGEAAALEGFRAVLVEAEAAHIPLIAARLTKAELEFEMTMPKSEVHPDPEPEPVLAPRTLLELIAEAADDAALTALWKAHSDVWADEHTAAVKARLAVAA